MLKKIHDAVAGSVAATQLASSMAFPFLGQAKDNPDVCPTQVTANMMGS